MLFRMSWVLCMLIYLSINGQVFATPVHLCSAMAQNSVTSMPSSDTLKVHEHHHIEKQISSVDVAIEDKMKNCECVDCDCTANMVAQANSSLVTNIDLTVYLPPVGHMIRKSEQNFISLAHSNPLRPPIFVS